MGQGWSPGLSALLGLERLLYSSSSIPNFSVFLCCKVGSSMSLPPGDVAGISMLNTMRQSDTTRERGKSTELP